MSQASTPDGLQMTRLSLEAMSRHDWDRALARYADDAVVDLSPQGIGTFQGREAIRSVMEDWVGPYEHYRAEVEDFRELGNDVTFAVVLHGGQLPGGVPRPNGSRGNGGRRCRRTWTSCARSTRPGNVATSARVSGLTPRSSS
jgi:ketosteroid isomerase-like protein